MPTLNSRALKVTVVLDADELTAMPDPVAARTVLHINVAGRTLTADLNSRSVHKARATIAASGEAGCAMILQGKLLGERIEEAGLVAQPKAAKEKAA